MYQPHMIEVDPQRIKFNKLNPRKHGGEEYERLKQSIQEMGIIQPPLLRHTAGIFYEVIDGEGRVSVAQDLVMPTIKAINLGDVRDNEALEMLMASNTVRQFGFIAECRGMAELHRNGKKTESIAKQVGLTAPVAYHLISIGYFPQDILDMLSGTFTESVNVPEYIEGTSTIWGHRTIREFLPLRQPKLGSTVNNRAEVAPLDETRYDFSEVSIAVQKLVRGELKTQADIRAYVADRRRELFEARFGKELQERLEAEITNAKQALEEAKAQEVELKVKGAEAEVARYYQSQIAVLEAQKTEIEKKYNSALAKAAKGEKADTLEAELEEMRKRSEADRTKIQREMQERLRQEQERQRQEQERQLAAMKAQVEASMKEQREALQKDREEARRHQEEEQKQAKANLEAYYKDQDAKRKLKAETSYKQLVANVSERLSQSRQSVDHIMQQEMIRGMEWLSREEIGELLLQIRIVRSTLDEAEQAIQKQMGVVPSHEEAAIESDQAYERNLVNHG